MPGSPASVYERLGGEAGVRALVETFYDILETDPEGRIVHDLHLGGFGMAHVREAQFAFLCGFLGGPRYYVERNGHSNLKLIHAHIAFDRRHAEAWLLCMARAIAALGLGADLGERLMRSFERASAVLVAQAEALHGGGSRAPEPAGSASAPEA